MRLLVASVIYFLAHVLRATRFWLLLGDTHVSILRTVRRFYLLNITGLFVPSFFMEPMKTIALFGLCRSRVQTVLAYFVYRTMDLLGIGLLLLAACSFHRGALAWTSSEFPWRFYCGLCALGSFLLLVLASAKVAFLPLQNYFLRRHHHALGTNFLRLLCNCARVSSRVAGEKSNSLFVPLILTMLAWILDIVAISTVAPHAPPFQLVSDWLSGSVMALNSLSSPAHNHRAFIDRQLFWMQGIPASLLVFMSLVPRRSIRELFLRLCRVVRINPSPPRAVVR